MHVMILCTFEHDFTQFYLGLPMACRPSGARLAGQAVISDSKQSTMLDPDGAHHAAFAVWEDTVRERTVLSEQMGPHYWLLKWKQICPCLSN